jgi:hypothetical protein
MSTHIAFKSPHTQEIRSVKFGWSWTLFLFSLVLGIPLFRRRLYGWGAVCAVLGFVIFIFALPDQTGRLRQQDEIPLLVTAILGIALSVWLGWRGNRMTENRLSRRGWLRVEPDRPAIDEMQPQRGRVDVGSPSHQAAARRSIWSPARVIGTVAGLAVVVVAIIGLASSMEDGQLHSSATNAGTTTSRKAAEGEAPSKASSVTNARDIVDKWAENYANFGAALTNEYQTRLSGFAARQNTRAANLLEFNWELGAEALTSAPGLKMTLALAQDLRQTVGSSRLQETLDAMGKTETTADVDACTSEQDFEVPDSYVEKTLDNKPLPQALLRIETKTTYTVEALAFDKLKLVKVSAVSDILAQSFPDTFEKFGDYSILVTPRLGTLTWSFIHADAKQDVAPRSEPVNVLLIDPSYSQEAIVNQLKQLMAMCH